MSLGMCPGKMYLIAGFFLSALFPGCHDMSISSLPCDPHHYDSASSWV
jgi:hypothetical protein